jgi:hypothetical protein
MGCSGCSLSLAPLNLVVSFLKNMSRLIISLLLISTPLESFADHIYAGFELIESEVQETTKNDDLLLTGGIDFEFDKLNSFAIEFGISDTEHNNGVYLKTNVIYNYSLMNIGNIKPYFSTGVFGAIYETEICTNTTIPIGNGNFQSALDCSSYFSNATGIIVSIGSKIKFNADNVFLLKLSTLKDNDNNSLITFTIVQEF